MKTFLSVVTAIFFTATTFAQLGTAPQKMSYQAVIRNNSNLLVQNSPVGVKISLLEGSITGQAVYVETHSAQTNENGLINLQIGGGSVVSGIYQNGIYWGQPYFIKTEIDPLGGVNYTITSTSELLSVPVSNFAHVSGSLHGPAWKFIGAYLTDPQSEFDMSGYSYMTYLGTNKVLWSFTTPYVDYNSNGQQDENENPMHYKLYGTVFDNVITFNSQDIGQGGNSPEITGTLVGNNLTMSVSDNGNVFEFGLVKQ
jgi:hypothetical protein